MIHTYTHDCQRNIIHLKDNLTIRIVIFNMTLLSSIGLNLFPNDKTRFSNERNKP